MVRNEIPKGGWVSYKTVREEDKGFRNRLLEMFEDVVSVKSEEGVKYFVRPFPEIPEDYFPDNDFVQVATRSRPFSDEDVEKYTEAVKQGKDCRVDVIRERRDAYVPFRMGWKRLPRRNILWMRFNPR